MRGKMYKRFYLWLSLLSGLVLFIYLLSAGYREATPEWRIYQDKYKELLVGYAEDDATKKKAKSLETGVHQIYLGTLGKVDRCTNCHMGIENPLMAEAEIPLKMHSGDYLKHHPADQYGCTICHNGQGRATNRKEAHGKGRDTYWDHPVLPFEYIESSCAACHDLTMLANKGFNTVVRGEKLFRERGCKGCHKLERVGGVLGNALDGIGSQSVAYFPMRYVEGEKTIYTWMKEHFDDPRNLVLDSEMISDLTDEESGLLTTYVLSLRSEEVPKKYRRIMGVPVSETSKEEGESLYKMYCIACHNTGKDSLYDEVFKRTIPAIMNPAFLKAADNKLLKTVISEGRADTPMTAWKTDAAGLTEKDMDNIIDYLTKDRPEEKSEPFGFSKFKGDTEFGEDLYKIRCMSCHGEKGQGGVGLNLRNPVVQKQLDPEFLAITVRDGRDGTPMAAFGKNGVGFGEQDIADVIAYVRTLSNKK
jgi:mono/diheme cytochrome c family protein